MRTICLLLVLLMIAASCSTNDYSSNTPEIEQVNEGNESNMNVQGERTPSAWFVERQEQRRITHIDYIIRGDYMPADRNIELQSIERFVFSIGSEHFGESFVLDKTHSRVYYDPYRHEIDVLELFPYSAELKDEDLERLIEMIERAGMRDWESHYEGEPSDRGSFGWRLGILFADGTMMRSGGRGGVMPQGADVLLSFIREIGTEIQERHHAEAEQSAQ